MYVDAGAMLGSIAGRAQAILPEPIKRSARLGSVANTIKRNSSHGIDMARIGGLALVIVSVLCACSSPSSGVAAVPSPSVTTSSSAVSSPAPTVPGSPTDVAGLPVVSVARAYELLQSGKLDGQAVAVAGYFDAEIPALPVSRAVHRTARELVSDRCLHRHPGKCAAMPVRRRRWHELRRGVRDEPVAMVHDRNHR